MSQAKVDRYKEEKKNRKKIQKKQKAKQVVEILVCAAILGALVGFPLGRHAYQKNYETRQANKTINASVYDYWAQQYWAANYTGYVFQQQAIAMLLQKMHLQQMQNNSLVYTLLKWDI